MNLRKFQIVWSATWGLIAVLSIVLWVRSYLWHDTMMYQNVSRTSAAGWNRGELFFLTSVLPDFFQITLPREFKFQHELPDYEHPFEDSYIGFQFDSMPGGGALLIPFWFVTLGSIACAALPCMHWSHRFSLRTLLIVTMLAAMLMGVTAWWWTRQHAALSVDCVDAPPSRP